MIPAQSRNDFLLIISIKIIAAKPIMANLPLVISEYFPHPKTYLLSANKSSPAERKQKLRDNLRKQTSINKVEEASFLDKNNEFKRTRSETKSTNAPKRNLRNQKGRYNVASKRDKPRDNSSRFDD